MRYWILLILCWFTLNLKAGNTVQEKNQKTNGAQTKQVEMADQLRSSGKIYVVVGVTTVILAGLLVYVYTLDRKVRRLEKQQNQQDS